MNSTPKTDALAATFMRGGKNHHHSPTFEAGLLYAHARELERQNAELVEALRLFMAHPANDGLGGDQQLIDACRRARAAISKATE